MMMMMMMMMMIVMMVMMIDDGELDVQLERSLAETRIWGTDINVQSCLNVFGNFVEYFGRQPGQVYHTIYHHHYQ
jgi:cytochrome bd-type quinol oxidase subunit 1